MSSASLLAQAARLHDAGDFEAAHQGYVEAIRFEPANSRAHYLIGMLELRAGRAAAALEHLRRSIAIEPAAADVWLAIGEAEAMRGENAAAMDALKRCVRQDRGNAVGWFKLGLAHEGRKAFDDAERAYRRALKLRPVFPEAWCNLGNALFARKDVGEAEVALRRSLVQREAFPECWRNLGIVLEQTGRNEEALQCFERACSLSPDFADAQFSRGVALGTLGRMVDAVDVYERVLALQPDHVGTYNNLGIIYLHECLLEEARECFERAIAIEPDHAKAHNNLGNAHLRRQAFVEAAASFARALALSREFPEAVVGAGMAAQELGDLDAAVDRYRQAIAMRPGYATAHANLGVALGLLGRSDEAKRALLHAHALSGNFMLKVLAATLLSPIMGSAASLQAEQSRIAAALDELASQPDALLATPEADLLEWLTPLFYAAFRGWNNRVLMRDLVRLYVRMTPTLASIAPHVGGPRRPGPIRVGFISANFFRHSVGNSYAGLLSGMAADPRLALTGISLGTVADEVTAAIRAACADWLQPRGSLASIREQIAALELDVLFYTDIGMDRVTYPLAMSRLATIQCIGGGHPESCGSPTIDYMVSSRLIEGEEARAFHTETLALLDALPTELVRPTVVADICTRAELGMDAFPGDRFYVCPTKLQKLHPDFDAALVRLVKADPQARIVLFEDMRHRHWRPLTEARQLRTMGEAATRVMFAPWADGRTFQSWLQQADIVLDCWPFGLGTTAILAVGLGVPIVTLPGSRMTSRTTLALMRLLDMHDLVAEDVDDYVKKAVSMAADRVLRQKVSSQISARSDRVFGRRDAARVTAEFFRSCLTSSEHT